MAWSWQTTSLASPSIKQKVIAAGGLFILGTERHESRRIDNQLRGRSGRQGDPGASEFYLSLEDDLMRLFGSERVSNVMEKLGLPEGEPITHNMISKAIANAQKKVESRNFGIRKNLLEFDDVMNKQRTAIYTSRNEALAKDDLKDTIMTMLRDNIHSLVAESLVGEFKEDWDMHGLAEKINELYEYEITDMDEYKSMSVEDYAAKLTEGIEANYNDRESHFGADMMRKLEKYILFEVVDARWRENLKTLDSLREGIYLRSYGQKDPIVEYKLLSGELYGKMLKTIKEEATSYLFKIRIRDEKEDLEMKRAETPKNVSYNTEEAEDEKSAQRSSDKVGRNDLCPCGSGKKYKKCCGRTV